MKTLELGCGSAKNPQAIGIDVNVDSNADIIHDLNVFPYPFASNEFDEIIATSIIEHLVDVIKVMEEIHRISKPDAVVRITVPHFTSWSGFTDPTHKHQFSTHSFDYFVKERPLSKYKYSRCFYELIKVELLRGASGRLRHIDRLLTRMANYFRESYEQRFAFIYPVEDLYFELKVKK